MNAVLSPPAPREGVRGSVDEYPLPDGIHRFPDGAVRLVGFDAVRHFFADCPGCPDCAPIFTTRDVSELR